MHLFYRINENINFQYVLWFLQMFPIAVACGNTFILKTSEKSAGDCYLLSPYGFCACHVFTLNFLLSQVNAKVHGKW